MNRKKKFISILIVIAMLLAFLPQTALATTYTLDSSVYNAINTNGVTIYELWAIMVILL